MGTSAPVRRKHSIPIVKPYKPPLRLSPGNPDEYVTPGVPVVEPEKVPERRE